MLIRNNSHLRINKFHKIVPPSTIGVVCSNSYGALMPGKVITLETKNQHEVSLLLRSVMPRPNKKEVGLVGFIQSKENGSQNFFRTGCLGRVLELKKENDRVVVKVVGVCRFDWTAELLDARVSYRVLNVDYSRYLSDLSDNSNNRVMEKNKLSISKLKLIKELSVHAVRSKKKINWKVVNNMSVSDIVASSINTVALSAVERQAIIEEQSPHRQAEIMTVLLEMKHRANIYDINTSANGVIIH